MKFYKILILLLAMAGCTPKSSWQKATWRAGETPQSSEFLNQIPQGPAQSTQVQDEVQDFSQQMHQGFPIGQSFVKKLSFTNGDIISWSAQYKNDLPTLSKSELEKFKKPDPAQRKILRQHQNRIDRFVEFSALWNEKNQLVWQGVYFEKDGRPFQLQFNSRLQIVSIKALQAPEFDRSATLYTLGPKLSSLQEVPLRNLQIEKDLKNNLVTIKNLEPLTFDLSLVLLQFAPEDPHFDALQVYYYVDRVQAWCEQNLGFKMRIPLNIQLQTGYPEKTNAAFYYAGNIRLGAGDGVAYSRLPQDPSIVMHEVFHSLVETLARLPHEGEGGSLNEAFADYFTSQVLGRPHLGESAYLQGPYKRTLSELKKWSQLKGSLYADSLVASSLLWQLSAKISPEKIQKIAVKVLARLNPNSVFKDFNFELQEVLKKDLDDAEFRIAKEILTEREFPNVE